MDLSKLSDAELRTLSEQLPSSDNLSGISDEQLRALHDQIVAASRPMPPQSGPTGDLMRDAGRFLGTAAIQAAAGMAAMPRMGAQAVDWLGRRVGLDVGAEQAMGSIAHPVNPDYPLFPDYETAKNAMMAGPGLSTGGTEYVPQSQVGRLGLSALSSALMGGAAGAMSGGLPGAVAALPSSAGAGAGAQGAADFATARGLPAIPAALAGALIGGVAAQKLGQLAAGPTPSVRPEIADLAQTARQKYDIPITAGQITENRFLRRVDSNLRNMPFTDYSRNTEQTRVAINRAIAREIGEAADNLSPDVMRRAQTRIGGIMDDVAQKTPRIGDMELIDRLGEIESNAKMSLQTNANKITAQIDDIMNRISDDKGAMTGSDYQSLTRYNRPLSRAIQNSDPDVRFYARQIRTALDDALERGAPRDEVAKLRTARRQWAAMKTIEDLAEKSPTGDINPRLLLEQVRRNTNNMAYGGGGNLAELGRISRQFLIEPPDSGTAGRLMIQSMTGDTGFGLVKNALARLLIDPLASRLLQSDMLANRMIKSGIEPASIMMVQPHPLAQMLMAELAADRAAANVSRPPNTNR